MFSPDAPTGSPLALRIGYVLEVYPRLAGTSVVNEILAHEAAGVPVDIFSLRSAVEGRFHEDIAAVRATVTYLSSGPPNVDTFWRRLRAAASELPGFGDALPLLLSADVDDAAQAVDLGSRILERRITHLHAHSAGFATTVARLAGLLTDVPFTFAAPPEDIYDRDVDEGDLRRKLTDAAATVAVTDYDVAFLRGRYGGAAGRVERVYDGLPLARFPYRAPFDRSPLIVAVGPLVERKGYADLITAVALLRRRGRFARCHIVGTGPLEHDLRERIRAAGLEEQVVLVGHQTHSAVVELVRSAAVFAAPSVVARDGERDGLLTVLLESMALGTPVVSTDVAGIPEAVRDGETGLVVEQHDAIALADALARLLDDASLRADLAAGARRLIESEFDTHRQAARLRAIMEAARRTIAGSPPRRPAGGGRQINLTTSRTMSRSPRAATATSTENTPNRTPSVPTN